MTREKKIDRRITDIEREFDLLASEAVRESDGQARYQDIVNALLIRRLAVLELKIEKKIK